MALPKRWINVTDPGWMLARAKPRATVLFTPRLQDVGHVDVLIPAVELRFPGRVLAVAQHQQDAPGGPAGSAELTSQPLEDARPDHLDIRRASVSPLPQLHAGLPVRRHRLGHVLPGGLIGRHVLARQRAGSVLTKRRAWRKIPGAVTSGTCM